MKFLFGIIVFFSLQPAFAQMSDDSLAPDVSEIETNQFSYQLIMENWLNLYDVDKSSVINPNNNVLRLHEVEYETRLFPVLDLKRNIVKVHFEPRIRIGSIAGKDSLENTIQELYSGIDLSEKLYLVLGKQRINWGSGMIWNPTNFYIQKDPLRTSNRLEGLFAARLEYYLAPFTLNLIVAPKERLELFNIAFRTEASFKALSYSFSYAFLGQNSHQAGLDFNVATDYVTFWAEGVLKNFTPYKIVNDSGDVITRPNPQTLGSTYHDIVAGFNATPHNSTSLLFEYHYKSEHNTALGIRNFKNNLPNSLPSYDAISMGQHTLFGGFNVREKFQRYMFRGGAFYDPVSRQLTWNPGVVYNRSNFDVDLNIFFFGKELRTYKNFTRLIVSLYF